MSKLDLLAPGPVLVDLWGVIHDGSELFPDAIPMLEGLKERDVRVCLFTNASWRARRVEEHVRKLGVPSELFDAVVSSGEAAHVWLRKRQPRVLMLGSFAHEALLEGPGIESVETIEDAEVVLVAGRHPETAAVLQHAHARDVLVLCANPDVQVPKLDGQMRPGVGAQVMGYPGRLLATGKPHGPIYALAEQVLGEAPGVAIGDGVRTDLAGAIAQGLPCVLVDRWDRYHNVEGATAIWADLWDEAV